MSGGGGGRGSSRLVEKNIENGQGRKPLLQIRVGPPQLIMFSSVCDKIDPPRVEVKHAAAEDAADLAGKGFVRC